MTTTEVIATSGLPNDSKRPQSWGNVAVSLCGKISTFPEHGRADLAALRRMDPDEPDSAIFWRLLAQHDLLNSGETVERKWALILHGIALMTPTGGRGYNSPSAHDPYMPVGRALFFGDKPRGENGFYSESRLNRLLTARGPMLRTLLARMFRMLAASNVSFNWREMAQFIMSEGYDEDAVEQSRRRIAREYYRAQRSSVPSDNEND